MKTSWIVSCMMIIAQAITHWKYNLPDNRFMWPFRRLPVLNNFLHDWLLEAGGENIFDTLFLTCHYLMFDIRWRHQIHTISVQVKIKPPGCLHYKSTAILSPRILIPVNKIQDTRCRQFHSGSILSLSCVSIYFKPIRDGQYFPIPQRFHITHDSLGQIKIIL